jgi:hypothetical protein
MRAILAASLLLLAAFPAVARDVRVFIAPRDSVIPRSGKVIFDIYWVNESNRPAAIPLRQRYSFIFSPLAPELAWGATEFATVTHPGFDRVIPAHRVIHESATAQIDASGAKVLEVSAEFIGNKSRFESNTVVLRATR